MSDPAPLYAVNRRHLEDLSDGIGIMQHALGPRPDPDHVYCTDDVSRSLSVDLLHARVLGWEAVSASAWRSFRFLAAAFQAPTGRFHNLRAADGTWLDGSGSDDAQARAMLALAESMGEGPDPEFRAAASDLFARARPAMLELGALRARSTALLACDAALRAGGNDDLLPTYDRLAAGLKNAFDPPATNREWPWPESVLTYENALVARAMLIGGMRLRRPDIVSVGCRLLDWLIEIQTAADGHLTTIGNRGWWPRHGARARFDQQPIEATTMMLAADAAWEATHLERYRVAAEAAYGWFLGANDAGVMVADPAEGACHDGLSPSGVNRNQGAESTLMWLTVVERVRAMRGRVVHQPHPSGLAGVSAVWV